MDKFIQIGNQNVCGDPELTIVLNTIIGLMLYFWAFGFAV